MYPVRIVKPPVRTTPIRSIVIHSTACRCDFPSLRVIKNNFQVPDVFAANIVLDKEEDTIFHFLLDKVNDDFYVVVGLPLYAASDGFDFGTTLFNQGIQVCIIGDLNIVKPPTRLYQILVYRLIAPLMFLFNIPYNNIVLHSELDKSVSCPGKNFDKDFMLTMLKRYRAH